ncbi:MAG: putative structural protein [Prokaryotic dsDNA virus sp.]|nr:MAG: putative structural protein [Prokaryotic dsDNA virus sp.]|tara:strand:- start:1191 stop:1931 length:741 start_codon:yes stop_codon:yes gene_type:complete
MSEFTVSYTPEQKGWPSFYSYIPDFMLGMNNYLYTFKDGELYRHNTNNLRNNYYGVQYNSKITSIFNQNPLQAKFFKTLELESDSAWTASLLTDLQTGNIQSDLFKKKEGAYYSFIRSNAGTENFNLRYATGIGQAQVVGGTVAATTIQFNVPITPIVSIGDTIFFGSTPDKAGPILSINADTKTITVDTTNNQQPAGGDFILSLKNSVAESQGILGYFCEFELENDSTNAVELFAVTADVFKSFP